MKKILLIEDDPFLIDIYSTKLKEAGFKFLVIKDGKEVLKIVQKEKPNLIILDIILPNIDGWQILRQIKKESKLKRIKIIILSNLSQKEEVIKGVKLGADKYFIKSDHTPSQIIKEINKLL
ncbi:MAG: response regulator [Patescibacteria group bacterium]|nr:response regulator [Patescibacteria group bacterium]